MDQPESAYFPDYYLTVPETEIKARLAGLTPLLADTPALFSWPSDLFYLTGSNQIGYLLLVPGRDPLFLVRRSVERATHETPLEVAPLGGFKDLGRRVLDRIGGPPPRLGLTMDTLPVREALGLAASLGDPELVDISPTLLEYRSVKSNWEMTQMARAGEIGRESYARLPELFRPGMTETGLAGALGGLMMELGGQAYMRTRSVNGEMYQYHLVAGKNTLIPGRYEAPFGGLGLTASFPQGPSLAPINPNEPVVVDFGTCFFGYEVDVTRMFCWGRLPGWAVAAYEALVEIERLLLTGLVPGANGRELYESAKARAVELGFETEFLGQGPSEIFFVGHGVGLEISEPPYLARGRDEFLKADQTLALELKMVCPGLGSVGLENTIAVTPQGGRKLSTADERITDLGARA